ncbi:hypothetical protein [Bhargavaea changchunensis]|uniref:hypothetical protein n=1 Tax=Bhargavaea changchunensis TaxID=2134037 RepID=UPI0036735F27
MIKIAVDGLHKLGIHNESPLQGSIRPKKEIYSSIRVCADEGLFTTAYKNPLISSGISGRDKGVFLSDQLTLKISVQLISE